VGYTTNWQLAVQQNLIANTVATIAYFGSKGTALTQQFYPNSAPHVEQFQGCFRSPCATGFECPYVTFMRVPTETASTMACSSSCNAGCAPAWVGTSVTPSTKPSTTAPVSPRTGRTGRRTRRSAGIRGQTLNLQLQYSSGVSARGGGLVSGWKGVLFRDWTVMPNLTVASGAPITVTDSQLALGGAPNGNIRADYTGQPAYSTAR